MARAMSLTEQVRQLCMTAEQERNEDIKDLEGKGYDPRKLLAPGYEGIKEIVKEKMELFGSIDKA